MYHHISGDSKTLTSYYGERTAKLSSSYLLPYIKSTSNILDVGCGPGTITADFSQLVQDGMATGIDSSPGITAEASSSFPASAFPNLSFAVGDALKLDFPDNTFDIVHAHQVLLHLPPPGPVTALKEFRRVCKPGGLVAVCDCSPATVLSLKPDLPAIRQYWERAMPGLARWGLNLMAGDDLEGYASEVGFSKFEFRKGRLGVPGHAGRMVGEAAEQTINMGIGTKDDMEEWRKAWEIWEAAEDKEWIFESGQILCWK